MKKVLVIGYFRPYFPFGSARVPMLAKSLSKFGWHPIILTPFLKQPPADNRFQILQTPYPGDVFMFWRKFIGHFLTVKEKESFTQTIKSKFNVKTKESFFDKLVTWYQEIFAYPSTEKKWFKAALATAENFLLTQKVDAIISVWPIESHLIAEKLKEKYMIPWIADFPDLWSGNSDYRFGKIRKWFDTRLEKKVIYSADKIITVSPPLTKQLTNLHHKPVSIILHGFDPEIINNPPATLTKSFTINYFGTLYAGKRDPKNLFIAIKELIKRGLIDPEKIEINFYGPTQSWLQSEITSNNLVSIAHQRGPVSREESIKLQKESQVLFFIGWGDKTYKDEGNFTGKIFEYFAARRPILMIGGPENELIKKLVEKTGAGISAIEVEAIKTVILKFYYDYKQTGSVCYDGDIKLVDEFSYEVSAKKIVGLLDELQV
ncbi:MAG: hypothetical protein WC297_00345 [Candidatus Paceibacterota bacterium]|jgi:hypothetical protein